MVVKGRPRGSQPPGDLNFENLRLVCVWNLGATWCYLVPPAAGFSQLDVLVQQPPTQNKRPVVWTEDSVAFRFSAAGFQCVERVAS